MSKIRCSALGFCKLQELEDWLNWRRTGEYTNSSYRNIIIVKNYVTNSLNDFFMLYYNAYIIVFCTSEILDTSRISRVL